jgi:branched-chain amino acid transport system substrate-binding protein
MKRLIGVAALAALLAGGAAHAQVNVKVGVLSDVSSLYSDIGGAGSVAAAKLAIADFIAANKDVKVELVSADHQNKPDVGSSIANQWFDVDKVDLIIDVPNSGVALAVSEIARQKNKVFIVSGAAASDLTGPKCNANTIHWTYDTWMLANGTGKALVKTGGNTWFFLTADYAFGHALERDTAAAVEANGGKVLGKVRVPLNTNDFSSFLLQAQASGAQVLGLANAGTDFSNSLKAANEFGITRTMKPAALLAFLTDIHSLGLATAQGLYLTTGWYWDLNDETRAFAKRFFAKIKRQPTMDQAGVYSATLTYLKAVKAAGTTDSDKVMAQLRKDKINDMFAKGGYIRADGAMIHDMYVMQVKTPQESKYPWDYYKIVRKMSGEDAFGPITGLCPLAPKQW